MFRKTQVLCFFNREVFYSCTENFLSVWNTYNEQTWKCKQFSPFKNLKGWNSGLVSWLAARACLLQVQPSAVPQMEHLKRAFLHVIAFHPTKARVWWQTSWPKFLQKSLSVFPLTGAQHSGRRTDQCPTHLPIHPRSSPSWRALGEAVTNQADFHLLEEGRGNGKDEKLHLTPSWRVSLYISLLHRKNV